MRQEFDLASSYEILQGRVIWKEHYHDILERACMTYGGDPCLFGKVTYV